MQCTMEQKSTDFESKESTLAAENVKRELLDQLEEDINRVAQEESTAESSNTSSRTKRSIIGAPPRQNKDGTPRYRRDARGILRPVYN